MMKNILVGLALTLGLFGCAGEHVEERAEKPSCEDLYTTCEWAAHRRGSIFSSYFAVMDCSWDYGVCIGKLGETECEEWCTGITWVPSECMYGCEAYGPPPTTTSTTGGS